MIPAVRVAHALVRAAAAFLSALARRPQEVAPVRVPDVSRAPLTSGLRPPGIENRCPVCQARFRGALTCSRCGADMEPLMLLSVQAWRLRQAALQALSAGDPELAVERAVEAQGIQDTPRGEALRLLGAWLQTVAINPPATPVMARSNSPATPESAPRSLPKNPGLISLKP